MKKNENGFGIVEALLIIFVVGVIAFVGWHFLNHPKTTVTTQSNYSSSGNCYDAIGETFTENSPPSEDQLSVKAIEQKSAQLTLSFKKDDKDYKFNYNGICIVNENIDGKTTKTIEFHLQKIEQQTQSTSTTGLNVSIGDPKEFSNSFTPVGNYLVKAFVDTKDSVTNKSLDTTILNGSLSF